MPITTHNSRQNQNPQSQTLAPQPGRVEIADQGGEFPKIRDDPGQRNDGDEAAEPAEEDRPAIGEHEGPEAIEGLPGPREGIMAEKIRVLGWDFGAVEGFEGSKERKVEPFGVREVENRRNGFEEEFWS